MREMDASDFSSPQTLA